MSTQKVFCYVDETGQETSGRLFLVAVVLLGAEREQLQTFLLGVEAATGKRLKWNRSRFANRIEYLRQVLCHPPLRQRILYASYEQTTDYVSATVDGVARSLLRLNLGGARITVLVDGLRRSEVRRFKVGLVHRGVRPHRIRGLREQSDPVLRLADAMAGFLRDVTEGLPYARQLYDELGLTQVIVRA